MAIVRVTKQYDFEMAHALKGYDGPCKHIHGHSYKLFVTVIGNPIADKNNTKLGMIIDFGDLKEIVKCEIVDIFDHSLVLNSDSKSDLSKQIDIIGNIIYVNYQPTCENFVVDFAHKIKNKLPEEIQLFSIRLFETATSYAEWYASDNE